VAAEQTLWRVLPDLLAGRAARLPNDLSQGSYFGGRKPEDGRIDWQHSAQQVYNLIRAVAPPYPGAYTEHAGQRIVIADARMASTALNTALGTAHLPTGLQVCGDARAIVVRRLLLDGQQIEVAPLFANAFANAPAALASLIHSLPHSLPSK
jgi:methionyl-tRNA formyltransferase